MRRRDVDALQRYLEARAFMPYEWGRCANDCISFLAGALFAQTGRTHLGRLTWSNKIGALRILKAEGGMEAALDRRFRQIAPAQAMRGDIAGVPVSVLADIPGDEAALIELHPFVVEGVTLTTPGSRGLRRVPRGMMTTAWSAIEDV